MIRVHLARLWRDRRLVLCICLGLLLALFLVNPGLRTLTLKETRTMSMAELSQTFPYLFGGSNVTREAFERQYANALLNSLLGRTPSMVIIAAVVASYFVGSCLARPINAEVCAGRARWRSALALCAATAIVAAVLSVLLTLLVAVFYAHDCLAVLGWESIGNLFYMARWRLFFDLAVFCPVVLMCFITREPYFALCGGAMLAALTTLFQMLQEQLWWFPTYAAQTVMLYQPDDMLRYVLPSLLLIVVTPIFAVWRLERCELR